MLFRTGIYSPFPSSSFRLHLSLCDVSALLQSPKFPLSKLHLPKVQTGPSSHLRRRLLGTYPTQQLPADLLADLVRCTTHPNDSSCDSRRCVQGHRYLDGSHSLLLGCGVVKGLSAPSGGFADLAELLSGRLTAPGTGSSNQGRGNDDWSPSVYHPGHSTDSQASPVIHSVGPFLHQRLVVPSRATAKIPNTTQPQRLIARRLDQLLLHSYRIARHRLQSFSCRLRDSTYRSPTTDRFIAFLLLNTHA